jgi:hypothetical protein
MEEWLAVIQVLPGVSVTLLAIAFVTFQVKLDIWSELPIRQSVAISNLVELSTPMFFSLIALMPGHPWIVAGRVTGVAGYIVIAVHLLLYWRTRTNPRTIFDKLQLVGAVSLIFTFSLLLWVPNLKVKVYVLIWMLFSGTVESWW